LGSNFPIRKRFISRSVTAINLAMKGILVIIGVAIGLIITLFGVVGDLFTAVDLIEVAEPAIEGNITDTVDKGTRFLSGYLVDVAIWALALTFLSSILAIFGIKIRPG
jgi:hypothetical protein